MQVSTVQVSTNSNCSAQNIESSWEALLSWFPRNQVVVVAFSGGVDSSLVLHAASMALGPQSVIAATADSASLARKEFLETQQFCQVRGIRQLVLKTQEQENPEYQKNDGNRCFFCKTALYETLNQVLSSQELARVLDSETSSSLPHVIVDGLNADDLRDIRPGRKAAELHGIRHPLVELNFSKSQVREVARLAGLTNWDKPAMACLASRISQGVPVSLHRLQQVEQAEGILAQYGFQGMRVRLHLLSGDTKISGTAEQQLARLEFQQNDIQRFFTLPEREQIVQQIKSLGFDYITVDCLGYRLGGR